MRKFIEFSKKLPTILLRFQQTNRYILLKKTKERINRFQSVGSVGHSLSHITTNTQSHNSDKPKRIIYVPSSAFNICVHAKQCWQTAWRNRKKRANTLQLKSPIIQFDRIVCNLPLFGLLLNVFVCVNTCCLPSDYWPAQKSGAL